MASVSKILKQLMIYNKDKKERQQELKKAYKNKLISKQNYTDKIEMLND
jgi:hypothetical protein